VAPLERKEEKYFKEFYQEAKEYLQKKDKEDFFNINHSNKKIDGRISI
jgi:hypothetical protein